MSPADHGVARRPSREVAFFVSGRLHRAGRKHALRNRRATSFTEPARLLSDGCVQSYLAGAGRVSLVLVLIAATAGSVLGALALYWLGRVVGEDRLRRWIDRIPLVDADDLDKADRWFERHENAAVLLGRCAPVVRSLVSIPAGANWMALGRSTVFTAIGSGVWNATVSPISYGSERARRERRHLTLSDGVRGRGSLLSGERRVRRIEARSPCWPGEPVQDPRMAERAASRGLVSGVKRSGQDPRMVKEVCSALLLTEAFGEKRRRARRLRTTGRRPLGYGLTRGCGGAVTGGK
jgi:membrane protein YqaA with SNARE-associated domain